MTRGPALGVNAELQLPIALILLISVASAGDATPRKVHQNAFYVIGIEARTTNAKEASSDGIIPKQWQKFFQDETLERIPHKTDQNIYAIYTDYASDRNGEYSYVIGCKVNDKSNVPAGMVLKTIPAGNYAMVTSQTGPVAKVIVAAWQQIWALEDNASLGGKRAYRADFEIYDQRAANPQNSQVDIYVGLK
jgi:predicted transcriptional regulator YdeE